MLRHLVAARLVGGGIGLFEGTTVLVIFDAPIGPRQAIRGFCLG